MKKATSPRSAEDRRPDSGSGHVARQAQARAYVKNHHGVSTHSTLADAIHNSPYVAAQRQRFVGMFGPSAQLKGGPQNGSPVDATKVFQRVTGGVAQCEWKDGVAGPPGFNAEVALANADWSHPKYVSVNLGREQPEDDHWRSYRITAWAPAIVGEWEVTVAAHVYFEANAKTRKLRRAEYGHLYVNDWTDYSTENDTIRQTVYAGVSKALLAKMPEIMKITDGSVDVVGAYHRPSFRPRRL